MKEQTQKLITNDKKKKNIMKRDQCNRYYLNRYNCPESTGNPTGSEK